MTNEEAPVTYLDEKWFYTTNRRRRIKRLPVGEGEEEGADTLPQPKVLSRRFPVKAMFMGVVGRPVPSKAFDGRIHLERLTVPDLISTAELSNEEEVLEEDI